MSDELKVNDRVHAGLREKGGSGFYGTIRKIEGTTVHIFTGPSAFGDLIVKSTIDLVSKEEEIVKNT